MKYKRRTIARFFALAAFAAAFIVAGCSDAIDGASGPFGDDDLITGDGEAANEAPVETMEFEGGNNCGNQYFPSLGYPCSAAGCSGIWTCKGDYSGLYCKTDPMCGGDEDSAEEIEAEEPIETADVEYDAAEEESVAEEDAFAEEETIDEVVEEPAEYEAELDEIIEEPAEIDTYEPEPEVTDNWEPESDPDPDYDPEYDPEYDEEIVEFDDYEAENEAEQSEYTGIYAGLENMTEQELRNALMNLTAGHTALGYSKAREVMYTKIDLVDGVKIQCVYTGVWITTNGDEPSSTVMNCEHTFCQSWGADVEPNRSDLNHLFPTASGANSRRSNYHFGWVLNPTWEEGGSKLGKDSEGETVFEVRVEHMGDTARAMFYYAVTYNTFITYKMEQVLKQWNKLDPVDDYEKARNDKIEYYQKTRNPFVDHPEFIDKISDF